MFFEFFYYKLIMLVKVLRRFKSNIIFQKKFFYKDINPLTLYEVIRDVENYKKFIIACSDSKITKRKSVDDFSAMLEIDYKLFKDSYVSHVVSSITSSTETTPIVYQISSTSTEKSFFNYLKSEFVFCEKDDGTQIDYRIEFDIANKLYNSITNSLKGIIANSTINCMIVETRKRENLLKNSQDDECTRVVFYYKVEWLCEFLVEKGYTKLENDVRELLKHESFRTKVYSLIDYFEDRKDLNDNFKSCLPLLEELCFRYKGSFQ